MNSTTTGSPKIAALEGLRGLMSFWVLLGHCSLAFGWRLALVDRNTLAVDVFIMLSGFVIARLISRRREPYGHYILRRGFRLFPLYLLAVLAGVVLLPIQAEAWRAVAALDPHNVERLALAQEGLARLPQHLVAHLFLAHGVVPEWLLPHAPYTLLGQAWSISLEWQFYLLAPLLVAALADRRWLWIAALVVLALLATSRGMTNAYLGNRIEVFLIGIASHLALEQCDRRTLWLGLALACGGLAVFRQGLLQAVPLAMWFAVVLPAMFARAAPLRALDRLLASRPLVHLGEISYSIYLIHMFPLILGIWTANRLGITGLPAQAGVTLATVAVSVALAEASWHWLEKPAIELGSQIVARSRARRAAATLA